MLDETFKGYCMAMDGSYPEPAIIDSTEKLTAFIADNVAKHHEIRITDDGDLLCFHCVEQKLIHPIPPQGAVNNLWNDTTKKFETVL